MIPQPKKDLPGFKIAAIGRVSFKRYSRKPGTKTFITSLCEIEYIIDELSEKEK
jgi:hypothetical protein